MDDMKFQLMEYLKTIEPHQKKFKVGYEARYYNVCRVAIAFVLWTCWANVTLPCRFGKLYWELPDNSDTKRGDGGFWLRKRPQRFSPW